MKKQKSVGLNAIINGLKTIFSIIFPLITFPYISGVLEVDNLGKYNFSHSIITYFQLLAALGVATYAVREGAKYRDSRDQISIFASEVFTLNVITTVISYIALLVVIAVSPKLQQYISILLLLSVTIAFQTIGCEWIYTIYEEYLYITIRTIIFQIISLILLFTLVNTKDDLLWYVLTVVLSTTGSNLINVFNLNKYCKLSLIFNKKILAHLMPLLILFANAVTTTIYVSSGVTVLGFLTTDFNVGMYSVAGKVYATVKRILAAVILVSIPRLSFLWGQKRRDEFVKLANNIFNALITMVLPMMVILFSLSEEIILILSTQSFLPAVLPLRILSVALMFCLVNWFFTSSILIPCKKEKQVLIATAVAALSNFAFNFLLIPYYKEVAAAITTLLAETTSLIFCLRFSRDLFKPEIKWKNIISIVLGCILIFAVCGLIKTQVSNVVGRILASSVLSFLGYFFLLVLLKNETAISVKKVFLQRLSYYRN